ncbi:MULTISPECIES: sulfite exporter TauE/SafE family protein [Bacillus]|uniref:sulfite exporter TauE/SafE family protein n=1 Tax=Bacillus TaxID=1386 RepID=UPI0022436818|nr:MULTISPECIES: sulfite exporter TauE/SafE family protein [Bacillus]MDN5389015.1 sulfite exporter TauE/SafE family protein [Bacillus sp. LB7]MEC1023100.1 sulfite exporter TauE/SafE family protein [Bacillus paralicheniformis]MEC1025675.1 sulfite exporter TauE/SafE family protein [Bacillus paralicheniformis]MEC1035545.1 sulfite exporter TauE/SafE family protein [Bacillus paralicheniformis]MEC1051589.1 sulfite exporter TauE/SafE family protein [Bacillus paralicheniformis]
MLIMLVMFLLGLVLGFVGAGGAGFVIALLTIMFHIPIHTALGTSLAGMAFTSLSGTYSHFREGNIKLKIGLTVGCFAAIGSFAGAKLTSLIPSSSLHYMTAGMLFLSAILILIRLFFLQEKEADQETNLAFWIKASLLGIVAGILSGTFGIGSAPFIQIGLMMMLNLSIRHSVGTTMLVIIPLSLGGGAGYISEGFVDYVLLVKILIGTMCGAYVGAKFTNVLPKVVLKSGLFLTPAVSGFILLF